MRSLVPCLVAMLAGCKGEGDACSAGTFGDDCGAGLHCSGEVGGVGTCVCDGIDLVLDLGDACPASCATCRGGLRCNQASDACIVPRTTPSGGPCADDEDCAADLLCGPAARCEPPNTHGRGEGCARDSDCEVGLVCDATSRCGDVGGEGAWCGRPEQCAPDLVCGPPLARKQCARRGIVGSLCDDASQCEAGLVCSRWYTPAQCARGDVWDGCIDDRDCREELECSNALCH